MSVKTYHSKPTRDGLKFPVCPECKEVHGRMKNE